MTDTTDDHPPIRSTKRAHIAVCYGCEQPTLIRDLHDDSAAMQCPRCGTFLRPADITTYIREDQA